MTDRFPVLVTAAVLALATLPAAAGAQALRDGPISRWDGRQWVQVSGSAARIAVGPDGVPWIVTADNRIFQQVRGEFRQLPGAARDISVGGDGTAWIIGTDDAVYRWNGTAWGRLNVSGVAISVERSGTAWLVGRDQRIHVWVGTRFIPYMGAARDVGAGSDDVWVTGTDNGIYRLTPEGWTPVPGSGGRISAGAPGTVWVVNDFGSIYRFENGAFHEVAGRAQDVAANARGDVWIVGMPGQAAPRPPQRR
jgi:hypothetical protein